MSKTFILDVLCRYMCKDVAKLTLSYLYFDRCIYCGEYFHNSYLIFRINYYCSYDCHDLFIKREINFQYKIKKKEIKERKRKNKNKKRIQR